MRKQTFFDWLTQEVVSARFSLIPLYEKKDRLLYVDAVSLRNEYILKIGGFEETVLEAELEVSLLSEKLKLIQIALNRRETIDMAKIEEQIAAKKDEMLKNVEKQDLTLHELPLLSEENEHTMHRIYRDIVSNFHPGLNPDITDSQRELYEKAMDAFRRQNLDELKLINNMLSSNDEMGNIDLSFDTERQTSLPEMRKAEYHQMASALGTDYFLAKKLYGCFAEQEDDIIVKCSIEQYKKQREELEKEIKEILSSFPFNAKDVINDKDKTEEYLAELRIRQKTCEIKKAELEKRIAQLTGDKAYE